MVVSRKLVTMDNSQLLEPPHLINVPALLVCLGISFGLFFLYRYRYKIKAIYMLFLNKKVVSKIPVKIGIRQSYSNTIKTKEEHSTCVEINPPYIIEPLLSKINNVHYIEAPKHFVKNHQSFLVKIFKIRFLFFFKKEKIMSGTIDEGDCTRFYIATKKCRCTIRLEVKNGNKKQWVVDK